MDINAVNKLISAFGFPIALTIALCVFIYIIYKDSIKREEWLRADAKVREDALRQELSKSKEVNAKAIEALALYAERLGGIEKDIKEVKQAVETLIE